MSFRAIVVVGNEKVKLELELAKQGMLLVRLEREFQMVKRIL